MQHGDLLGRELPRTSRQWSLRLFTDRHEVVYGPGLVVEEAWPERNIHSDHEAAKREGLPGAVASAPQLISMVHQIMLSAFGEGWIAGGRISVKMIKPVFVEDFTTAKGRITGLTLESVAGEDRKRAHCDVRVERRDGTPVLIGTASALTA
ncbi:MAG TPA: MaoC family dehydratase [Solirubrobacteraceae bacterium]|nr:MaoC family dehydratase [Solirubrobacteraceae bacterium]